MNAVFNLYLPAKKVLPLAAHVCDCDWPIGYKSFFKKKIERDNLRVFECARTHTHTHTHTHMYTCPGELTTNCTYSTNHVVHPRYTLWVKSVVCVALVALIEEHGLCFMCVCAYVRVCVCA